MRRSDEKSDTVAVVAIGSLFVVSAFAFWLHARGSEPEPKKEVAEQADADDDQWLRGRREEPENATNNTPAWSPGKAPERLFDEPAKPPDPKRLAAKVTKILGENGDVVDVACRARAAYDAIPERERSAPAVASAFYALKAKEAEALRQQQKEAEKNRGLICADGTESDSCTCHGKRRGCCSHHGGVRGCAPLPAKLSCP